MSTVALHYNAYSFTSLLTAVLGRRFPTSQRDPNAKRWLTIAYQDVWSAANWTFKTVSLEALAVTAGSSSPTMPGGFADALVLLDDAGEPIARMSEQDFENVFGTDIVDGSTGGVSGYTVVNRQILLGPAPDADATFRLSYRRRVCSRTAAGVVQDGMMRADGDYPLWDDHQAILIPRAQAIGLQEINDPQSSLAQQEYERQLDRMKSDYTARLVGQYGDAWDA